MGTVGSRSATRRTGRGRSPRTRSVGVRLGYGPIPAGRPSCLLACRAARPPTLGPMEMADIIIVIAAVLAVTLVLLNAWFDKPSADGTRAPRKHANR